MTAAELFLGTRADGSRAGVGASHLITHAVCLGMTGSGKTGLGIVALEELARRGVPLLIIDLKGDMTNLLLTFPGLRAEEFAPWLAPGLVAKGERAQLAAQQATLWRDGLAGVGLGGEDVAAVARGLRWQLLTPGVASAAPLDILPTLSLPPGVDPEDNPDITTLRVNAVTQALLSLIDRGGDPLTDRDHVLLSSIILEHWRRRDALDLPALLRAIADPGFDALGALPLEVFYPRKERMELLMALNTLLASPAFAAWTTGVELGMEALLGTPDDPRGTIVSLAHLDERQRLFALSLILSELVAWMLRQPAAGELRCLLYIDEVLGILPPHPANPPTKGPLLQLLKQGRAFGVGAWLATQNPVDLDYKALGNAGIKLIGRLITDNDRRRALEGLSLEGTADGADVDARVKGLDKREFVVANVHTPGEVFTLRSRWAMSYLRGPLTLAELRPLLTHQVGDRAPTAEAPADTGIAEAQAPPVLGTALATRFAAGGAGMAAPSLLVKARVTLEQKTYNLAHEDDELWQVPVTDDGTLDWEQGQLLEEPPELVSEAPSAMRFPAAAPAAMDRELATAAASFVDHRARQATDVLVNRKLKVAANPGESREELVARCLDAADKADDKRQEAVRSRYERKLATVKRRLEREQDELARDRDQLAARKAEETLGVVEGLFSVVFGSRSIGSAARKAAGKVRSTASKHRMRRAARASVVESENEIERLTDQLEELADEMTDEIEAIAAASEELAENVEEVAVRPRKADVAVHSVELVWGV